MSHGSRRWVRKLMDIARQECEPVGATAQDGGVTGRNHRRLILTAGKVSRFVVVAGDPSTSSRIVADTRAVIRRELRRMT